MYSKMVEKRGGDADRLSAAFDTHSQTAADVLSEVLQPYLEKEEAVPDLWQFQRLLARRLEGMRKELAEADSVHDKEVRDDRTVRFDRDEAATDLRERLVGIRRTVEGSFGPGASAALLGIEGNLPRDPRILRSIGSKLMMRLQEEGLQGRESRLSGVQLDPTAWVQELDEPLGRLDEALRRLDRESRQAETTLIAKQQAMEAYDRAYLATARLMEDFFAYAGLTELAERVRPSRRSVSGPGDGEEEPLPGGPEPTVPPASAPPPAEAVSAAPASETASALAVPAAAQAPLA